MRVGERRRSGPLEVYMADSPASAPRAGIVVPRYGRTTVERNRLKRRLREIVRSCWLPEAARRAPRDLVVRTRRDAYDCSFEDLREAMQAVAKEAGW